MSLGLGLLQLALVRSHQPRVVCCSLAWRLWIAVRWCWVTLHSKQSQARQMALPRRPARSRSTGERHHWQSV
jgi:hypothetical protein